MMFEWTPERIRYQIQEYENGNMPSVLASVVSSRCAGTICDVGCGVGFLSLALAGFGRSVVAVDTSHLVLEYLRSAASPSVSVLEGDVHALVPENPYGTMVCWNYGSLIECLALAKTQCSGTLVIIRKNWSGHRFSNQLSAMVDNPSNSTRLLLSSLSVPFTSQDVTAEDGPRFIDKEDAARFFSLYDTTFPSDELASRLVPITGNCALRYPLRSTYTCFFIPVSSIPFFPGLTNVLVCGERGIGKSTLIDFLFPDKGSATGFQTKKVGNDVYLNAPGSRFHDEAHLVGHCAEMRGKGIPSAFDEWGCRCLSFPGAWRVMDEIGFLENDALRFRSAVLSALEDDISTICAVKDKDTLFLNEVRSGKKSLLLHLTAENRDAWKRELQRAIPLVPEWRFALAVRPYLS